MLAFFNMGPPEWIVILVVALLLFGRRLPEVMRNLGKGIVEFKRGVRGIEDQIDDESSRPAAPPPQQHEAVSSPAEGDAADGPAQPQPPEKTDN
jgi:sec-independent protein translocase protein TatA